MVDYFANVTSQCPLHNSERTHYLPSCQITCLRNMFWAVICELKYKAFSNVLYLVWIYIAFLFHSEVMTENICQGDSVLDLVRQQTVKVMVSPHTECALFFLL